MKKRNLSSQEVAYLAEHYPDTDNQELADKVGISICTVKARAVRHKWHKSDAYLSKQRRETAIKADNASRLNSQQSYLKRVETQRKVCSADMVRLRWGLEPVFKNRHYRTEPRERLLQRNRLERLGYIVDKEKLIAYYTDKTHRAVRLEAVPRGQKKGSIKPYYEFKPYEEKE